MGELWTIIQEHLDAYGVREAEFARRIGSSPQTVNSWKKRGIRNLPERRLLLAVAEITGREYADVLEAALTDADYLGGDLPAAARRGTGKTKGERLRDRDALLGEEPDPDGPEGGA
ncbi:immunity repressor [Gordonia phage Fairfaxidum]|uniref:Immunity repressor n=1 Tax=Gordonia phage Fairfaxidum TaxID=2572526 RepID=A0A4D6TA86_9CAUD|nr:immunity repressor [Gordonia phage Fairfaxidum]QCG77627.1 immunity repressor [Gordonia phage Fairfaxidum]